MKSFILQRYLFKEILFVTLLNTFVLTAILLYGNLIKNDESIFQALSLSHSSFLGLVFLLIPYSLSMGLPFGFALAVLFCFGRWSANREILGLRSLGINLQSWFLPVLILALLFSGLSSFASLHWSPVNRGKFDKRKNEIIWQNLNSVLQKEGQIDFEVDEETDLESMDSFQTLSEEKLERISISVSEITKGIWKNVRILLFGDKNKVISVIHAKRAIIHIDRVKSLALTLKLREIDLEPGYSKSSKVKNFDSSFFVSFDSWKYPLTINLAVTDDSSSIKKMGLGRVLRILENSKDEDQLQKAKVSLSKNIALGTSPLFLFLVLVPLAAKKGRKETMINIGVGIFICLLYYGFGFFSSSLLGSNPLNFLGWWIPNLLCLIIGTFFLLNFEKT